MGVFEKVKGSGIWWVQYFSHGRRHREKVGTRDSAQKLYIKRKGQAIADEKMPELRKRRVLLSELIDHAVEYATTHNASVRDYVTKGHILKAAMGDREASSLTPQEIARWLAKQCKTAGTYNRYKAFISLCYREGMGNGKVSSNPARLVRAKKQSPGRLRFLSRDEADRLEAAIAGRFPSHLSEYLVALHTGMRLSEQYTLAWKQVRLDQATIDLTKTKNGYPRTIPLNSVALAALRRQREVSSGPMVFPRAGANMATRSWFHPVLEDAGIDGFVWHGLRHTFCSWLAMAGVSLKSIQELAGHKAISMSARYSHLSPDHKRGEIERMVEGPKVIEMPKRGVSA